ncbi:MAG: complex I subunit 4 family protein [Candidatus Cyclobacteriaceae bacterium M2_1C_046]
MLDYLLSLLIFIPLAGSALCLVIPKNNASVARYIALLVSVIQIILTLFLIGGWQKGITGVNDITGFQFVEKASWIRLSLGDIGTLAADYFIGIDGISVMMVILAVIVLFVGVISSWKVTDRQKSYFSLYLLLNGSIIGCFVALDFLLFYLFFEFMLLPMYFLIGLWGGPRREYASIKFFLYTLAGSLLILIVMIGLALSSNVDGVHIFNLVALTDPASYGADSLLAPGGTNIIWGLPARELFFLLIFIGFAIKVPVIPLHTWLPDAHVEAPTPISVVLAGLLLKTGAYALIRTGFFIFPDVLDKYALLIASVGAVSIIYAGLNALAQKDLKKMIAYSSISHMGFVMVGLASLTVEGFAGAIYQMFSHGILSPLLFIIAGVLYDRTKDRAIYDYSGLAAKMPQYAIVTALAFFAALGLPGFSGFIAEITVLLGAFKSPASNEILPVWPAVLATVGLLIGAAYFLWTFQRMFLGKFFSKKVDIKLLPDLTLREKMLCIGLLIISFLFGIFPSLLLDFINEDSIKAIEFIFSRITG